jgi:hypothetical protein
VTGPDSTPLAGLLARVFDAPRLELLDQEPLQEALFADLLRESPGHADLVAELYEARTGRRLALGPAGVPLDTRHPAMSDELKTGLDHCAGHCFATGWGDLCTTTVFQVYRSEHPWIVAALPEGALREVEPDYTGQLLPIGQAGLLPSACVGSSLAGLCAHAPPGTRVTFHDLFFDLARFGTGRSVQRLRDHGVGQPELRRLTTSLGLGRLSRHGPLTTE